MKRKTAEALVDISPIITKGTLLERYNGYYVKLGETKQTHRLKLSFAWWRFRRPQIVECPNYYLANQVEEQPQYFKTHELKKL
jgi:hypothetical protein